MHRTLAALLGAALILFISYTAGTFDKNYFILSFEDALAAIDMNVIFLLMGMMIIVGVLKKTGLFQWLAYKSYALARGNVFALAGILMVVTAVASAFLDNVTTMLLMIPVTIEIAVIPIVAFLNTTIPGAESGILWWSLSLGACLGGNGTMIGASANVVTVGLAEKAGYHISFVQYLKVCWWPMIITIVLCNVYLLLVTFVRPLTMSR
jgi:Na+/H+ antiporter NhaD/arsenite permease-like protein